MIVRLTANREGFKELTETLKIILCQASSSDDSGSRD